MKPLLHLMIAALGAALLFMASDAVGAPLMIVNGDFTAFQDSFGGFGPLDSGWGPDEFNGTFPGIGAYGTAGVDGVGYIENEFSSDEVYMEQTLSDVLTENTKYTLMVDMIFAGLPYRIELRAGSTVLAEDNNSLVIPPNDFVTSTISYTALPGDLLLGQPLSIRMVAGPSPDGGSEVDVDNVRLDATLVPEPQSAMILATGAGLLVASRFRRSWTRMKRKEDAAFCGGSASR